MKNLQSIIRLSIASDSDVVAYCVDSDNGALFALTIDLKLLKTQIYSENIAKEEQNFNEKISSLIGVKSISQNDVRLFEFIVEMGGLLLALRSGHLLIISSASTDCHCIFKHERSIDSISLSPSQDLIALADDESNIQVMYSSDCEVIRKSNALTQNESLHKPVGVGWGSKETQFFGLDGRPSHEKKEAAKIELGDDEIAISDKIENSLEFQKFKNRQERSTVIDWRGDGQLIGTLTYIAESDKHYLKVWNRNLELQYMSEQLVTVERGQLCWIPDGQYLCCAQRRDRRLNEVALFEKNGLVRQRISLPSMMANTYISDMAWSSDSKIFAIIVKQFRVHINGKIIVDNILMLFTMQNWHYYLKSSIKLQGACDHSLKWDVININRLHLMSTKGLYVEFDCCFQVSSSEQFSAVAVVDANKVLITPLESCLIPPPMSAITLETDSPIYRVAIDRCGMIYILTLKGELIYTYEDSTKMKESPMKVKLNNRVANILHDIYEYYSITLLDEIESYQHIVPIGKLQLVASKLTSNGSEIICIKLPINPERDTPNLIRLAEFKGKQVICLSHSTKDQSELLCIILNDCSSFLLDLHTSKLVPSQKFQLAIAESRFSYNIIDLQTINSPTETVVISLGQDYCLRFNNDIIASNSCTSFRLTENYLIYTSLENSVHFTLLENMLHKTTVDSAESWQQPIETGGTIVVVAEKDSRLVLQMPRGNLETIHPRILLFSSLTVLLDQKCYVEACKLARRHRVNMNFLIDYLMRVDEHLESHWAHFSEDIANYDPNLLCLVLTELDNGDTISGRYQSIIKHLPNRQSDFTKKFEISDKINRFCSAILLPSDHKFLYPRIQKFLRMEPKQTEAALNIVHSLDQNLRMDAIKYILYFIDIDQLFKDALGTYDMDIALMVASASNHDPKQYLALLDSFKSIENNTLYRFEIDMHIKRYDSAFNNLSTYLFTQKEGFKATEEKLVDLVVSKRIYRHAILHLESLGDHMEYNYEYERANIIDSEPNSPDMLTSRIWAKYAEYLLEKRHYDEAGLAYSKALRTSCSLDHFNSALKCYSLIEDWEKSIALIKRCKIETKSKLEASKKISKQLVERSKYCEATIVELLISSQFESNIDFDWCMDSSNPGNWYLAEILTVNKQIRFSSGGDLVACAETVLNGWLAELEAARNQFERLKELMLSPQARQDTIQERGFVTDTLSTIDGSEISSMSGLEGQQLAKIARSGATSIKTRNSSKSTKSSQKRINLKVGSRHEDIALVLELKKFISKQKSNHEECSRYLAALFQYLAATARAYKYLVCFHQVMAKSLEFAQEISELLWPTGAHLEQRYSLYKRAPINDVLLNDNPENVDFEILIRPELPKALNLFEI